MGKLEMMNRAEHLQWAKNRAIEYVDLGDFPSAIASMHSDLNKHPDLNYDKKLIAALYGILIAEPLTKKRVTKWINDFN